MTRDPEIKSALKGRRFQDTEDIQKSCDDGTESYSITGVPKCFQQWQHRWVNCTAAEGEYLECDPSQQAVLIQCEVCNIIIPVTS